MFKFFCLFAVLSTLCVSVLAGKDAENVFMVHAKVCADENGITEKEFVDAKSKLMDQDSNVKESIKCGMKCLMEKNGFFDASGKFNADAFKSRIPYTDEKKMDNILAACKQIEHTNSCEKAFKILACLCKNHQLESAN